MGADIHTLLGRVNPLATGRRPSSGATQVQVLAPTPIEFEQFEFLDYDTRESSDVDTGLMRDYELFSWLAGVRGGLAPLVADQRAFKATTMAFVDWLTKSDARAANLEMRGAFGYHRDDWRIRHLGGDHSFVLYPLQVLRSFDYESPAVPAPQDESELDARFYEARVARTKGRTYRDIFDRSYFDMLDWAHANDWHFVLFTFDN